MKQCLALILIMCVLTLPVCAGEGSFSVVYLPADDRPLWDQQMRLFAESLGVELIMPERRLYGRNGTDDRGELLRWLSDQQGDCYIISLDQLLSGGLLESRELTDPHPITLPTGETLTEEETILFLKEITGGKQVYFLDSLLRLACNVTSEQDLEAYYATLDDHRGASQGRDYPAARIRKLRLNLCAAANLPGYLLGVDDSWAGETIQSGELRLLRQYVPEERIFSTFDGLPRVALAKLYLERAGVTPKVTVRYFGDQTLIPTHNFESAEEMAAKTLRFFGGEEGDDLEVLILTETGQAQAAVQAARQNQRCHVPTILINLCQRSEDFEEAFLTLAPGQLLSYAGYGSSVNGTHLGLSMGIARYAALAKGGGNQEGHLLLLATMLADELGYASIVEEVRAEARALGLDLYDFRQDFSGLERFTLEKMKAQTAPVLSALQNGGILTDLDPYRVSQRGTITLTGGYFPWHRCFEYHGVLSVSRKGK